jgi:hypothetical protein
VSRRLLAPLVVAALVAGGTTAASRSWPVLPREPRPVMPTSVPVAERNLVCPDLSGVPGRTVTRVTVAALPGPDGAGVAEMSGLGDGFPAPLPRLAGTAAAAGAVAQTDVAVPSGPARLAARGPLAARVAAEQVTRSDGGPARGLAETRCAAAAAERWFVGGSTGVGAAATLLLVNPDDVPATADVSLLTPGGPVTPRSAQGIEVPARGSVRLALETLAPNAAALATHVVVRAGRLASTVLDSRHRADLPLGVDYLPPAAAAAATVVVPGLPAGPGVRRVYLAAPGTDDATVELRVVSTEGTFVPDALNAIRVPAGTVVPVDLGNVLAGRPASVVATSDVPVLAGGFASAVDPRTGVGEFAWTGATAPLSGSALLPDNRTRDAVDSVLLLSAPGAAATVSVTALPGGAGPVAGPFPVQVPAGHTTVVALHALAIPPGSFALVVTPATDSGPVYAARVLVELGSRGLLLSTLSLERTETTATVPAVVPDPAAGTAGTP